MPWADVVVPSLASGLLITRIGCYLYGCDFGTRLAKTSPGWLQKLGGTSPTPRRHARIRRQGKPPHRQHPLRASPQDVPGHGLQGRRLHQPKDPRFRCTRRRFTSRSSAWASSRFCSGTASTRSSGDRFFFTFVFAYGFLRFLLELCVTTRSAATSRPRPTAHSHFGRPAPLRARVHLRHLARHPEQERAERHAGAVGRAGDRGLRDAQARAVRVGRVPPLDEPVDRPAERS